MSSIEGIKAAIAGIKPLDNTQGVGKAEPAKGGGFADMLSNSIREIDNMQKHADDQIQGMVTGKDGVTPHDAMIALEKADISFRLMNSIRSKIVRAYEEVMRTQI